MSRSFATLALVLAALSAPVAASADAVADLHALFEREWERDLADNPLSPPISATRATTTGCRTSARRAGRAQCRGCESAGRPRPYSARAAAARRAAQLRPVPARVRDPQGGAAVPPRVLLDRGQRRPAVAGRTRRTGAVRDGRRLRDLDPPHAGDPGLPGPVWRPAAPRGEGKAHATAGGHGTRAGTAGQAGDGRARGQPLLRALPQLPRRDPGRRPRAAHGRSEAGDRGIRDSGLSALPGRVPRRVPAGDPPDGRDLGHAGRARALPVPRALSHDHDADARRDPCRSA